ncbi:MAG: NAD(P)/FAD-dependent oxidoreductase [Burkholderiales bacterium]
MKRLARRDFLKLTAAGATGSAIPWLFANRARAQNTKKPIGRAVVIGGGYGGATVAKYLRLWSAGAVEVLMVERDAEFVSCPISNLVLSGTRKIGDITRSYARLRDYGVQVIRDEVAAVDTEKKRVKLRRGGELPWDRLVVSPGVHLMHERIEGYDAEAQKSVLHAWKAGPETLALRQRIESMPDGGVFVIAIPMAPYRCPPGPYERACQVAFYFKLAKPRSKILILDANEDVTSKGPLFRAAWNELYKSMIEYRPNNEVRAVDARAGVVKTDFDAIKGDVLNVLPPMRAGEIARSASLITANARWCGVDWLTMESLAQKGIHVLGDSTLSAPAMPKSGHMANQHGKLAAAAIIELMNGRAPDPQPALTSTCYSFVSDKEAIHVASVHHYDPAQKTFEPVHGAGGVSTARNETEGAYGWAWAQNIWADMLD